MIQTHDLLYFFFTPKSSFSNHTIPTDLHMIPLAPLCHCAHAIPPWLHPNLVVNYNNNHKDPHKTPISSPFTLVGHSHQSHTVDSLTVAC